MSGRPEGLEEPSRELITRNLEQCLLGDIVFSQLIEIRITLSPVSYYAVEFLERYAEHLQGVKIRIIATIQSNIGNPEAILMLTKLPNTEVKVYKGSESFPAKSWLLSDKKGNQIAYISSGNFKWTVRNENTSICIDAFNNFDAYWYRKDLQPLGENRSTEKDLIEVGPDNQWLLDRVIEARWKKSGETDKETTADQLKRLLENGRAYVERCDAEMKKEKARIMKLREFLKPGRQREQLSKLDDTTSPAQDVVEEQAKRHDADNTQAETKISNREELTEAHAQPLQKRKIDNITDAGQGIDAQQIKRPKQTTPVTVPAIKQEKESKESDPSTLLEQAALKTPQRNGSTVWKTILKCQRVSDQNRHRKYVNVVGLLLEHGADPNVKVLVAGLSGFECPLHFLVHEIVNDKGETPVWLKLLKLLLFHGADPNIKDGGGKTPAQHLKPQCVGCLHNLDRDTADYMYKVTECFRTHGARDIPELIVHGCDYCPGGSKSKMRREYGEARR